MNSVVITGIAKKSSDILLRGTFFRMYDFFINSLSVPVISVQPLNEGIITIECQAYSYFSKDYKGRKLNLCLLFVGYTDVSPHIILSGHVYKVGKFVDSGKGCYVPITVCVGDASNASYIPCFCKNKLAQKAKYLTPPVPVEFEGELCLKDDPRIKIKRFLKLYDRCSY